MSKINQIRQGDVLLVRVDSIPEDTNKNIKEKHRAVLAFGEVTGHLHQMEAPIRQLKYRMTPQGKRFIELLKAVALKHEEHAAIMVTEGKWQQAFQVEDWGDEVRRVQD